LYLGQCEYTDAEAYCAIGLSSCLLRMVEKVVYSYIRDGALREFPLFQNQFAYQPGISTVTALHSEVTCAERMVEHKEMVHEAFLDIEGAFDQTSLEAIASAARRHGVEPILCRWINSMLQTTLIGASLLGDTLRISTYMDNKEWGVYHLCCGA